MKKLYTQDISAACGALQTDEKTLLESVKNVESAIIGFAEKIKSNELPAFNGVLKEGEENAAAIRPWKDKFEHVLFLGMGGSSLGGKLIDGFADSSCMMKPRLHFIDYLDPKALSCLVKRLPFEQTGVVIISKSGGTLETLLQAFVIADCYRNAGLDFSEHFMVVTEPKESALTRFAKQYGIKTLAHNPNVGGRFSIMAQTGVLPAAIKGIDVVAFHSGMQQVVDEFLVNPIGCKPAVGAALHAVAAKDGRNINAIYAYGESLRLLPAWFEQLWAESLGKEGKGTTPLGAAGPFSQHSIQQLFLAGPKDKLFTLILPETKCRGPFVEEQQFKPQLNNVHCGTLQQAMGEGTLQALKDRNQPVRTFEVPKVNAESMGALLMHFMLETVLTATIWDVNPFDQSAVEESKIRSLEALERLQG